MSTPTLQQARRQHAQQQSIVALAVKAVRRLFAQNRPLIEVASTVATYQTAAALSSTQTIATYAEASTPITNAAAFTGVSSLGFPITEPLVATIDRFEPAPLEPLPANWWTDAETFMATVEQLVASEIADAARTASQVEFVGRPDWQNYVRVLTPPSCARCAILAGRIYRDLDAFDRHPRCDCVMVPVQSWQSAHDAGLISSFQDAYDKGQIGGNRAMPDGSRRFEPGLSAADLQAIADGADPGTVVNARRGTSAPGITNALTTEVFGRKVKATTYGTTKRAAWRKANPTRLVRLRPESIYEHAKDRDDAIRLLKLYGYITDDEPRGSSHHGRPDSSGSPRRAERTSSPSSGGAGAKPPKVPRTSAGSGDRPPGRVDRNGVKVRQHELDTANRLAANGHDVAFQPRTDGRSPDIILDGNDLWEMKSPTGASRHTIASNLRGARGQSGSVVLDLARTPLDDETVIQDARDAMRRYPELQELLILLTDGSEMRLGGG